ncbi:hypothetical protein IAD21_00643 [Abditibacteriota bacterium]|nr:hypothetical protein IAD21_00643 [Abditibacteriota bacterium]
MKMKAHLHLLFVALVFSCMAVFNPFNASSAWAQPRYGPLSSSVDVPASLPSNQSISSSDGFDVTDKSPTSFYADFFRISVAAPGQLEITQDSGDDLDTYLKLFNASGELLAENDDDNQGVLGVGSRIVYQVSTPGIYYIVASTFNGLDTGNYTLNVSSTPGQASFAPPKPSMGNVSYLLEKNAAFSYQLAGGSGNLPGNALTYSKTGGALPDGMTVGPNGLLSGTPTTLGVTTATIQVSNGSGTASGTLKIEIIDEYDAPILAPIGNKTVTVGNELAFTATATDPNNDTLKFSLAAGSDPVPVGATIDPNSGAFSWTPTQAQGPGVYSFKVVVKDNGTPVKSDEEEIKITVQAPNTAPTIQSVTITPNAPKTGDTLTANVVASDAESNTITYTYVWKTDGVVTKTTPKTSATSDTFDLSQKGNGDKGQTIVCTVTPNDGTTDGTAGSDTVTVANSAPVISGVTIDQSAPKTGDTLSVTVAATDPDGDAVAKEKLYQWIKNSFDRISQTGPTYDLSAVDNGDKGDKISVRVTVSDGTDSSSKESPQVTIVNSAPVINSVTIAPASPSTNDLLSVTVAATDPDGDAVAKEKLYQWIKNSFDRVSQTGPTYDLSQIGNGDKGDKISVRVTVSDGTDSSSKESPQVTIVNSAPVIASVTLTPIHPLTNDTLTAIVEASDVDGATPTYSYVWKRKNGAVIAADYNYKKTLDLSQPGVGDDGDTITCTVTANDGSTDSTPVTSAPVTIGNLAPTVDSVSPQGVTDTVGTKRPFTLVMSDGNGARDIREMWLLINTQLDWSSGATLIYRPSTSDPTRGQLFLRRGDAFLPPITIGSGGGASGVLDNGAVRVVGSDVTVSVSKDGNSITLTLPVTVREGLAGENTLFARVQDGEGATDPSAQPGEFGFVRKMNVRDGHYTVWSPTRMANNTPPKLSDLTPGATYTTLNAQGIAPAPQTFGFFVKDEDGTTDIESVWFLAGKVRDWAHSATFVYYPRTRRLVLRSDDGQSFLGGGQIGMPGIIENSQVKVDLSRVILRIYPDGKSLGLSLPLQGKTGLLGHNSIWLRVQDTRGATSTDGDPLGFARKGGWDLEANKKKDAPPKPSNGNS